jgi:CBS domain containing-hemolysin-like protein
VLRFDLLKAHIEEKSDKILEDFKRPLHLIPDTQDLASLFETMISERIHIAAMVDEFGAFSGLVTLEDVIETILGDEIIDEADTTEDMQQKARELWKKRARKMDLPTDGE